MNHKIRRDMITTHAWETWTKNGLNLGDEALAETTKTVQDAVNNTFDGESQTDLEWLDAALRRLSNN
jgi:hypothetical protein